MRKAPWEHLIGKPFVDGGRGPDGYDCIGLVLAVYRDVYGIELPDYDIGATAVRDIADAIQTAAGSPRWTRSGPETAPAVVVMALHEEHPDLVNHCGVCIGGRILHTIKGIGAHVFTLPSPVWNGRIKGYYQWTGSPTIA
ncbi:MAG: C40 family peptidase [Acidobacteriales bacterium]|nr:C40 family peptidase [Terriglobales bacterium]